jgi:molybdopterin-guanine dinucleotide biosynthesis protein A
MKARTGALLCGGQSSRMGSDKALLEVESQPLWRLQLAKLRAVCDSVIVCGSPSQAALFAGESVRFAADAVPGLGPLSGIARALELAQTSHVLILAVDMPKMSEGYLRGLCDAVEERWGVVPEKDGAFEGLCAVYPTDLLPWIASLLSGADRSLHALIRLGLENQMLRPRPIAPAELNLFENWNTPSDITAPGPRH